MNVSFHPLAERELNDAAQYGLLKHHDVPLEYTIEDFEREGRPVPVSGRSDNKNSQLSASVADDPSDCYR